MPKKKEKAAAVEPMIKRLVGSTKRIIIAIDAKGVHFRETLCVTHDGESGESRYDTKPVFSLKHPRKFRRELLRLIEKHV